MQPLNDERAKSRSEFGHERSRSLALVDRHAAKDEEGRTVVPTTAKEKVEDFISTVKTILKVPVFVGSMVGRIIDVLAFKGFFVFLPKYLEVQFGLPQHKVNFYLGIVGVSGFAVGVIIGSSAMRKFKLQGRKAAGLVAVCSLIGALFSFVNAAVGCKSAMSLLAEKSVRVNGNFSTACNADCDCHDVPLYPVCNRQGQVFYSPCHAGCPLDQSLADASSEKVFPDCLCSNSTDRVVSREFCGQSVCETKFVWYFVNMAVGGIFSGVGIIPAVLIFLRAVPPMDRSISLGFQGFLISLLATLPSPVMWGWIVDKSCVLWNTVCDDTSRGACALYDADKLRLTTHITYGVIRMISLITDFWVFYFAKDLVLTDEEPTSDAEVKSNSQVEVVKGLVDDVLIDKDRKFSM